MCLINCLKINKGKNTYIPNPGNAGDSLIALGTMHLFKNINLMYNVGDIRKKYIDRTLIYAGGGNLTSDYNNCENFLINNAKDNKIIVLPHTIKNVDHLLQKKYIKNNVTFFCREYISYNYVKNFTDNVYLHNDLAFSISKNFLSQIGDHALFFNNTNMPESKIAYCFRDDKEKTNIVLPKGNNDISKTMTLTNGTSNLRKVISVCNYFFSYLYSFDEIHTNRLHVSIAASLLGKKCYLYPNNYYKNKAVYDFSLKGYFPSTYFIESDILSEERC